jgi:hypothetical protein
MVNFGGSTIDPEGPDEQLSRFWPTEILLRVGEQAK